jgi:hypothetical protein
MTKTMNLLAFTIVLVVGFCHGFAPTISPKSRYENKFVLYETKSNSFRVSVTMPPTGSGMQANMAFEPVLSVPSEIVEVRYKVPFGLNVEPKKGLAVCTKDGEGGEKVGDVLRYASHWTLGLPKGDGLVTQAAAFSGGLSWQCTMFNVMKAKEWGQVVEALLSNEQVRRGPRELKYKKNLRRQHELVLGLRICRRVLTTSQQSTNHFSHTNIL